MSRAVDLYRKHSLSDLHAMQVAIHEAPESQNPEYKKGSIYLYTPKARKKLDDIAWAITYHLQDKHNGGGANG